jgi:small nuclear ribonucleoprotein (snRNP)-like protein
MAEQKGFLRVLEEKLGTELMVWTTGGHFFRGQLREITADGFLVLGDVSCTLAGERQEREMVFINAEATDAVS